MSYIFSAVNDKYSPPVLNAFYRISDKADYEKAGTWPDKYIEISEEVYSKFNMAPPAGKTVGVIDGRPAWVDIPPLSHDEMIVMVQQKKQILIDAAMLSVSTIQLKLQAGRKLTDAENVKLDATLDYIDAVSAINPEDGPDINWPIIS
ncbi:tail fiber assembly protein [Pantoea tagorei]